MQPGVAMSGVFLGLCEHEHEHGTRRQDRVTCWLCAAAAPGLGGLLADAGVPVLAEASR